MKRTVKAWAVERLEALTAEVAKHPEMMPDWMWPCNMCGWHPIALATELRAIIAALKKRDEAVWKVVKEMESPGLWNNIVSRSAVWVYVMNNWAARLREALDE